MKRTASVISMLLSGALVVTLGMSNMAGLFPERVYAVSGTIRTSQLGDNEEVTIDGDTTIIIDGDKTIKYIAGGGTGEGSVTIKGDGVHTLTSKDCINLRYYDLIIESGKLVIYKGENGGGLAGSNVEINGGTVECEGGIDAREGHSLTIRGGNVKSLKSGSVAISCECDLTITGGTIEAFGGLYGLGSTKGKISISGTNTRVKAGYTESTGGNAIESGTGLVIAPELYVSYPEGGGLSADGIFIATKKGGNIPAREIVIEPLKYSLTQEASSWTKDSGDYTIIINPDEAFDRFSGITIDGKELSENTDFEKSHGSLKLTIRSAFISKLPEGDHPIVVSFNDGRSLNYNLNIKAPSPSPLPSPSYNYDDDDDYEPTPVTQPVPDKTANRKAPKTGEV